jgi:GAF domain-containing protein
MKAPLPADEEEQLKTLHNYEIMDTGPEQEFDDITLLASRICGIPIAIISLIDENRQWFKSKVGMAESETAHDITFCAHGILQADSFAVPDAQADERFSTNPLVTGAAKMRFYAGVPLIVSDGQALGMLCVIDQVPRELSL